MASHPDNHPMQAAELPADVASARRRAIAAHPAGARRTGDRAVAAAAVSVTTRLEPMGSAAPGPMARTVNRVRQQEGAMAAEYGLLVVVGATICSLVVRWASGGAVFRLLDDVLRSAGRLLGL